MFQMPMLTVRLKGCLDAHHTSPRQGVARHNQWAFPPPYSCYCSMAVCIVAWQGLAGSQKALTPTMEPKPILDRAQYFG
jgi:hypothetical protein